MVQRDRQADGDRGTAPAALLQPAPNGTGSIRRAAAAPVVDAGDGAAANDALLAPWRTEAERRKAGGGEAPTEDDTVATADPAEEGTGASAGGSTAQVSAATESSTEASTWSVGWSADAAAFDGQEDDARQLVADVAVADPDDEQIVGAEPDSGVDQEAGSEAAGETAGDGVAAVGGGEKTGRSRGSKEERVAERSRRRQLAMDEGGEEGDDKSTPMMPLVRHLNTVTKELALAYRTIGQVTTERDMLKRQIYEIQGLPTPEEEETATTRANSNRGTRQEARAEVKLARAEARGAEPSLSPEEVAEKLRKLVWRRRAIALGGLALLAAIYVALPSMLDNFTWENFSRDSFANIAYVGSIFQIFLIGFVIYRIARVGGKAGRWLFPGDELPRKRRR